MPQSGSFAGRVEQILVSRKNESRSPEIQAKVKKDGEALHRPKGTLGFHQAG